VNTNDRPARPGRDRPDEPPASTASPLGQRLRDERDRRGMGLRELARRLDVSPSLVSQIETGKVQPSVRTLYAMVSELGVSLDEMFVRESEGESAASVAPLARAPGGRSEPDLAGRESGPSESRVQRADERAAIELEAGVRWERLTTWNDRDVDFLFTIYEVGGASCPPGALVRHNGREFGIVLKGRLGVTVGFQEHTLEAGDSVSFASTTPHRLHNDGDEVVHAIWVVLGRYHES
jgi:transcriptional regulator with XRE-family HTH domain